ncbi:MAG: rRNA maturation RNase YbeY [Flavobacteriaceae bacterium]|jgi:rRNA maturation RNase YbeY|nr:rRNA maturation RNase YbeY [Flavobacteriaceae bacterium]
MIDFNFETDFVLEDENKHQVWIKDIIIDFGFELGDVAYIFCDDDYLLQINLQYLNHDDLTDIISFDYSENKTISGDIFISIERVKDNAHQFNVDFHQELLRVMSHGILHFMGFKDKNTEDRNEMQKNEEICIQKYINN